ncbi:hypothetical protein NXS19_010641 [Fusarium pseudograminearum]|uniref:Uncharacterized protein n=1 Tax=Fusarium pseudograminearum (strain CS3096) TaxID=1028729 RepID=K3V9Y2_FUSPC|nr:hypothetical protein FPSE_10978 [Fusarium pseudograminearum CS3096]EKJ68858.1 hypothetical protein FPSE_10978 [Fusarium pseudograminearum CS3096]KAF0635282.1 hypothetical protein FPSE5266_10978 [Fusarium pseudograminearum]QPC80016.1 hypothetical protein HYE68_010768 [Fusarium pseudograminearum]UZP42825.1 hypothetical protein NXS19_010641 [Fusarium pseudograminearum]
MDFVKNAMGGGNKDGATNSNAGGAQKEDYVDKAFSAINKKAGTNISRDNQEKITDFGRSAYEKQSGSKVDPKYSN